MWGGGVSHKVILHDKGGRGGQDPPKKYDIIYEQPLLLDFVCRAAPGFAQSAKHWFQVIQRLGNEKWMWNNHRRVLPQLIYPVYLLDSITTAGELHKYDWRPAVKRIWK